MSPFKKSQIWAIINIGYDGNAWDEQRLEYGLVFYSIDSLYLCMYSDHFNLKVNCLNPDPQSAYLFYGVNIIYLNTTSHL